MKYIKKTLAYIVSIFTAIMLILGTLCYVGAIPSLTLSESIYKVVLMAVVTAAFTTFKDEFITDNPLLDFIIGVIGCSVLVFVVGLIGGWMAFDLYSFLLVFGVTILVYLFVWFMTVMQSKKDADELNEQLTSLKNKK
ncbi:MAG: DUF3021 family protein [Oscillospiraceae bacterium]